jgi:hypothetical protein
MSSSERRCGRCPPPSTNERSSSERGQQRAGTCEHGGQRWVAAWGGGGRGWRTVVNETEWDERVGARVDKIHLTYNGRKWVID